jgi:hypothetical protein
VAVQVMKIFCRCQPLSARPYTDYKVLLVHPTQVASSARLRDSLVASGLAGPGPNDPANALLTTALEIWGWAWTYRRASISSRQVRRPVLEWPGPVNPAENRTAGRCHYSEGRSIWARLIPGLIHAHRRARPGHPHRQQRPTYRPAHVTLHKTWTLGRDLVIS